MTPDERRARAIRIQAMLDDPEITDAFVSIRTDLTEEWARTHCPIERENLWRSVQLIEKLKTWMASAATHDLTSLRRFGK